MRKLLYTLLLLPSLAFGQTKAIVYTTLAPSPTGFGGSGAFTTYYNSGQSPVIGTDAQIDSAWAIVKSAHTVQGLPLWQATEVQGTDTNALKRGAYSEIDYYQAPASSLQQYQVSRWAPVSISVKNIDATDTGLVAVFIPASNFAVTGVYVNGGNDTAGYTSNATVKVGTAAGAYDEIVSSANPSLGSPTLAAATLVSPRKIVPAGSTLYLHKTTAAVATTEHFDVIVTGSYQYTY